MLWVPGYVECATMGDAKTCPDPVPDGYDAWLIYAGGTSAAHVYDEAELARVAHLHRLPCWVPTPGRDDPVQAAHGFLSWALAHELASPDPRTGEHLCLMWDMETGHEPDPAWLDRAAQETATHGWHNLVYGSLSTLFGQPPRAGYMVANPTGVPHLFARADVQGTQYAFDVPTPGGKIDQWLIARSLLHGLLRPVG